MVGFYFITFFLHLHFYCEFFIQFMVEISSIGALTWLSMSDPFAIFDVSN